MYCIILLLDIIDLIILFIVFMLDIIFAHCVATEKTAYSAAAEKMAKNKFIFLKTLYKKNDNGSRNSLSSIIRTTTILNINRCNIFPPMLINMPRQKIRQRKETVVICIERTTVLSYRIRCQIFSP
jgi:hypothetical protein